MNKEDELKKLAAKIDKLLYKQNQLTNELLQLKTELADKVGEKLVSTQDILSEKDSQEDIWTPPPAAKPTLKQKLGKKLPAHLKQNTEKFIGENLISILGVVVLVIGVGIGAKYAFEHQMISPIMRIIAGYVIAIGLLGFAIKLKPNYHNFSAVLLSGSLAIMYFLTFAAYDFYSLLPKLMAFAIMVILTVFTTLASLKYNKQVIAHIGFVGAYAVPFLLSDGTGSVAMLYSYMAIVNLGILVVSVKQYWKSLYYTAFVFTWVIYLAAFDNKLHIPDDLTLLLSFLSVYFLTFYTVFISYKVVHKELFLKIDILMLLSNALVAYSLGYYMLSDFTAGKAYLGIFTVIHAFIHFGVALLIKKQNLADRNLFYLVIGLVLTFITMAIPVQLNGHWVTLLWTGEALVLFCIGRNRQVPMYEKMAYPLMLLSVFSLFQDWSQAYQGVYEYTTKSNLTPFFNVQFLTSLLCAVGFGTLVYIKARFKIENKVFKNQDYTQLLSVLMNIAFALIAFATFALELANYWNHAYFGSAIKVTVEALDTEITQFNDSLKNIGGIWSFNYTLFFLSLLAFINTKYIKNEKLAYVNLILAVLGIVLFLTKALFLLSELREVYLHPDLHTYFTASPMYIYLRYISLLFLVAMVWMAYYTTKQPFMHKSFHRPFVLSLAFIVLWVASSELIHWLDMAQVEGTYKLGLSILWGVYALVLVALGIYKRYKYLRLGAIILFGITLAKLFVYDMAKLSTLSKTIVFVILGILLLIVSFLYNKFKHRILDDQPAKPFGNEE